MGYQALFTNKQLFKIMERIRKKWLKQLIGGYKGPKRP